MTPTPTLRDQIETRLLAGEDPAAIAASLGLHTATDADSRQSWDGLAVILPGWTADDGTAALEYPDASSAEEAAADYVADGDWGDGTETSWVRVYAWQTALGVVRYEGADGEPDELELVEGDVARESHTQEIEAVEPDCVEDGEHDWRAPYRLVGGLQENPGVVGHGGGVISTEVCVRCGLVRHTDTWAQDPSTGEQGLTGVSYDAEDSRLDEYVSELAERIDADPDLVREREELSGGVWLGRAGWRWWVGAPGRQTCAYLDEADARDEARRLVEELTE